MTGNEMLSTLGLRLEDPTESSFTEAAKLDALNIAQRSVVNLIHNAYLTDLQTIDVYTLHATNGYTANNLSTDGAITFTTAGVSPIRNGIIAIEVFDYTGSSGSYTASSLGFATMIEPEDVKRLENAYLAGSTSNPVAYIFAETIYVKGSTITSGSTSAINIWYIKQPTAIAANTTECELNIALHEAVVDFAENQLWKMDAKPERAGLAYQSGTAQITALNARYVAEAPSGIGTKNRV